MRVLVLTHRLPYAPNRGDRLRVYHMLQHLRTRAEVELVSLVHDDDEAAHVDDVKAFVARVTTLRVPKWRNRLAAAFALPTNRPLTHALLDAPGMAEALAAVVRDHRPDVVFAYCSSMARFAMQPPLDRIPMVLDFVDVDSRKWHDLAAAARSPRSWIYTREARTLGAFEAEAARCAATALVVNQREANNVRALAPAANVRVLLNGVELDRLRPQQPPSLLPRIAFCGMMDYAPNHDGMLWFVRSVWPLIKSSRPDATLAIIGANPLPELRQLCEPDPSITVTGRVDDVRPWLWDAAIAVAPLHVARGVQNKALEALAAGLPIVMTAAVAEGLPRAAVNASLVASTPAQFADHALHLLAQSPDMRRSIAASCDFTALTWPRTLEQLAPILESACDFATGDSAATQSISSTTPARDLHSGPSRLSSAPLR